MTSDTPRAAGSNDPVVVIGGGIVGTSLAYFLRHADTPVYLFEKGTLGSGTTAASIAQFIQHQDRPSPAEYERRRWAWDWYESHIDAGTFSFDRIGTLHVGADAETCGEVAALEADHAAFGVETELLDSTQLERFGLQTDALECGFFLPADGYLDPAEIVQYLAAEARTAGVTVETGVAVTDVRTRGGSVVGVETTAGTYDAGTVINAAGPWAPALNERLGVSVPLRHTKGPIIVVTVDWDRTFPLTFFEEGVYVRSEGRNQLLAGHFATAYADATRYDPDHAIGVEESFYLDVADVLDRYLPAAADGRVQNEWVGLRTVTPDGRPIVGETPIEGYLLAVGMSGYGVTLAPTVGHLVATWLRSGQKPPLLESLSPARFE